MEQIKDPLNRITYNQEKKISKKQTNCYQINAKITNKKEFNYIFAFCKKFFSVTKDLVICCLNKKKIFILQFKSHLILKKN